MYYHRINHRYKPIIIVPYIAIEKNINFLSSKDKVYVITADDIKSEVIRCEQKQTDDCIDDIKALYNMDFETYISKWVKVYGNDITKEWLVKIELKKIEDGI
jgi:uncharacterized protein YnzC (UPF0291/DUF896 family)